MNNKYIHSQFNTSLRRVHDLHISGHMRSETIHGNRCSLIGDLNYLRRLGSLSLSRKQRCGKRIKRNQCSERQKYLRYKNVKQEGLRLWAREVWWYASAFTRFGLQFCVIRCLDVNIACDCNSRLFCLWFRALHGIINRSEEPIHMLNIRVQLRALFQPWN